MKRLSRHILFILSATLVLCSCTGRGIIPRDDMARIYADMFMLDVTISKQYGLRRTADTTRVYAAIFEKYGYTEDDFLRSREKYLNDPGRYVKMINKAQHLLEKEKRVYSDEIRRQNEARAFEKRRREILEGTREDIKFWPDTVWAISSFDSLMMPFRVNFFKCDTISSWLEKADSTTAAAPIVEKTDPQAEEEGEIILFDDDDMKKKVPEKTPVNLKKLTDQTNIEKIEWTNAAF